MDGVFFSGLIIGVVRDRGLNLLRPRPRYAGGVSLWKRVKCFPSTIPRGNLKTLNDHRLFFSFFWAKLGQGNHVTNVIPSFSKSWVFKTFGPHWDARSAFSNSSGLKEVFGKLCFRDGLVWTVDLTIEIKLHFQIPLAQWGRGFRYADICSTFMKARAITVRTDCSGYILFHSVTWCFRQVFSRHFIWANVCSESFSMFWWACHEGEVLSHHHQGREIYCDLQYAHRENGKKSKACTVCFQHQFNHKGIWNTKSKIE